MKTSLIIIAHNEGDRLWKTVRSCVENPPDCEYEIIVVDDASEDNSINELMRRYPTVRLVTHERRRGVAPARNTGAGASQGDILVFIDAHCHPEPDAFSRLVTDVEQCDGKAIIAPRIALLDAESWTNSTTTCGNGYALDLETFEQTYVRLYTLRRKGNLYESPNLVGCCFALARDLYARLDGCDPAMQFWGSEQVDLGLKAWLLGYSVLNDIEAVIGHRFQDDFEDFQVPAPHILVNQLRVARKHFIDGVWNCWLPGFQATQPEDVWSRAWAIFTGGRRNIEDERARLQNARRFDEFWYADKFDQPWPLSLASVGRRASLIEAARQRYCRQIDEASMARTIQTPLGPIALQVRTAVRQWGDVEVTAAAFMAGDDRLADATAMLLSRIDGRTLKYVSELQAEDLEQPAICALAAVRELLNQFSHEDQMPRDRDFSALAFCK